MSYTYKEDSGYGRSTWILRLEDESWERVKHLFNERGKPINENIKRIPAENSVWDLHAISYYVQGDKLIHKIYGVSGDYTFGNAPTYYQQRLRGNKKAAKKVFDNFIEKYL
jgi:hypothetical protein